MDNGQLVPELRFPEFLGEWKSKRIEKLFAEFKSGNNITAKKIKKTGKFPVYGGNGLRGYTNTYTHDDFYLLIGRQGALCGNINRANGKVYISEHAIACKANEENDTEWMAQRLDYYNLNRLSESSAQPGLSVGKLLRFKLVIPQKEEQQKIANFLTAIDQRITLLKQKKAALEQYKKGLMQKIFSQEIRFKDDQGNDFPDWEEVKLGDVGKTLNGLTGKTKENFGQGKQYVQYTQIFKDSKININECGLVEISKNEKQTLLKKGDVLFTTSSETPHEIGISSVLIEDIDEVYLNSFCFGYRQTQETFMPSFSQFFFRSEKIRKEIIKLAQGSTRFNMSKVELMKLKFKVPCIEEQQKIANFLSFTDKKITTLDKQITETEAFKKGLLHRMFV